MGDTLTRSFEFKLYPSTSQQARLGEQLAFNRALYNAALEQRNAAYRRDLQITLAEQKRELTELRQAVPELLPAAGLALRRQTWRVRRARLPLRRVRRAARP